MKEKLNIKVNDWSYTCGDGCCYECEHIEMVNEADDEFSTRKLRTDYEEGEDVKLNITA